MGIVFPGNVTIQEVCPRDGLQILKDFIPTKKKIELIRSLEKAGCKRIEATAYVHPKWVPQMADSESIAEACDAEGVEYSFLVPNERGVKRALSAGAKELVFFLSASEKHNHNNVNKSVRESLSELVDIAKRYSDLGLTLRVNLATAFGYEDEVPIKGEVVENICTTLSGAGYHGITLCDSTGVAEPESVYELSSQIIMLCPNTPIALHLHQANGREYANVLAGLKAGIQIFDSAVGGLGGCPYAPGASGNIATETLCLFLEQLGISTGIELGRIKTSASLAKKLQSNTIR